MNYFHLCARSMGNLIKVLTRDIDNNGGNFFLDFESKTHGSTQACTYKSTCTLFDL